MKLSRILVGLQDGTLFGRFGFYLSGTACDRSQDKPLVQIRHKVLCGDDSIEIDNWLPVKFDPIEHNPNIRRMTPVFVEIQGQRAVRDRVITKGQIHVVEDNATAANTLAAMSRISATQPTSQSNPVPE